MKKKILITGSSGMLGSNLVNRIPDKYEVFGSYRTVPHPGAANSVQVDLADGDSIKAMMDLARPDCVVHCAALTDVEFCESDYAKARAVNAGATGELVLLAGARTRFIYISTDSVFDGARGNYSETDLPSPLNNYAKTKLEGEWFVEQRSKNYAIIRTNIVGWNLVRGQSFPEWIVRSLDGGSAIKMFTDAMMSPLTVTTLSRFIDTLLKSDFVGRVNIATSDSVSKYDFGRRMAEVFGLDASLIEGSSIDSFGFKAPRPKDTSLDVSLAGKIFGRLPSVEEEIKELYNTKRID